MPSQGMQIIQEIKVQLVRNPPHVKDAHHAPERFSGLDITLYQPVPLLLNVISSKEPATKLPTGSVSGRPKVDQDKIDTQNYPYP